MVLNTLLADKSVGACHAYSSQTQPSWIQNVVLPTQQAVLQTSFRFNIAKLQPLRTLVKNFFSRPPSRPSGVATSFFRFRLSRDRDLRAGQM